MYWCIRTFRSFFNFVNIHAACHSHRRKNDSTICGVVKLSFSYSLHIRVFFVSTIFFPALFHPLATGINYVKRPFDTAQRTQNYFLLSQIHFVNLPCWYYLNELATLSIKPEKNLGPDNVCKTLEPVMTTRKTMFHVRSSHTWPPHLRNLALMIWYGNSSGSVAW